MDKGFVSIDTVEIMWCDSTCKTCNVGTGMCESCFENGTLHYIMHQRCVEKCPEGWINDGNYTCKLKPNSLCKLNATY